MKYFRAFILLLLSFMCALSAHSQCIHFEEEDKIIYEKYINLINTKGYTSKSDILQLTSEFFLGKPYVSGSLDINKDETLVVNLREFDCITFVETVIALYNTVLSEDFSFINFTSNLKKIRYRNGMIEDYSSRLHYTSDWVYDNLHKGLISDIEWTLDNVVDTKQINFMSTHRYSYKLLKGDDIMFKKIVDVEDNINSRGGFSYLSKNNIESNIDKIPHMAFIAFTTKIEGLDTTHAGFTYKHGNGTLGFIHASSIRKRVVIDVNTLSDYCNHQKSCTGLIIMNVE